MNYNQLLSMLWAIVSIWFVDPVALDYPSGVCEDRVKAAHKYHGIIYSYTEDGIDYFDRKGERCKLYTQGFNDWYERKVKSVVR